MSKIIFAIFLLLFIFILGCTNFLNESKSNLSTEDVANKNVGDSSELSKCTYLNGFNDSLKNQIPDDLCFLIKNPEYKNGFRNGTRYNSKMDLKNSIIKILDEKIKGRNSMMKSGIVYGISSEALDERSREISEMKNEVSSINKELKQLEITL